MLPHIGIVLNEREPDKRRLAETLDQQLAAFEITSFRPELDQRLALKLRASKAKIIVLDYLLGDLSTGLDLLDEFASWDEAHRPAVIMLTDESSASVAVAAMKRGAVEYIETSRPDAIEQCIAVIKKLLTESLSNLRSTAPTYYISNFNDLVKSSQPMAKLVASLQKHPQQSQITSLSGKPGAGLMTLARATLQERLVPAVIEINLQTYCADLRSLLNNFIARQNKEPTGLIVAHAELDDGELLQLLVETTQSKHVAELFINNMLLCFYDETTADRFKKSLPMENYLVAPLSQRSQEIPELCARLIAKLRLKLSIKKVLIPDEKLMELLVSTQWSGGIRQFNAVISNLLTSSYTSTAQVEAELMDEITAWEEHNTLREQTAISPLYAAAALRRNQYFPRRAAVSLGLSPAELMRALNGVLQHDLNRTK